MFVSAADRTPQPGGSAHTAQLKSRDSVNLNDKTIRSVTLAWASNLSQPARHRLVDAAEDRGEPRRADEPDRRGRPHEGS